jgi:acyl-coenzyme A thioesterase PaaI-like protein
MEGPTAGDALDQEWLNDSSEYQVNFVHGLRNPHGLHLQYHLAGERVVTTWVAGDEHAGFPGFVHGGLIAAVLDDAMGRCSVLRRRWVVTGRMETRFRDAAPIGSSLRVEGWITRMTRRLMTAEACMTRDDDGSVIAESNGTYLPIPAALLHRMIDSWPGFAEFTGEGA